MKTASNDLPGAPAGWVHDVRAARVDLYCDHDGAALAHLQHAQAALLAEHGAHAAALPHLAHAQRLAQQHRYGEAHEELQAALGLDTPGG